MLGLSTLLNNGGKNPRGRRPTASLMCLHPQTGKELKGDPSSLNATSRELIGDGPHTLPSIFYFQYFPESIQDTKSSNLSAKDIPGASLPIYNWVGSSERSLSFDAVFTTDTDLSQSGDTVGYINIDEDLVARQSPNLSRRNIDIRAALAHLRMLMTPKYGVVDSQFLTSAPPTLILTIPGSGIGLIGGGSHGSTDGVRVYMNRCDISFEAFFPSGFPRVATASLGFVETAQVPGSAVDFPTRPRMNVLDRKNQYLVYNFGVPDAK